MIHEGNTQTEAIGLPSTVQRYPTYKDSRVDWLGDVPEHWEVLPNQAIFVEVIEQNCPDEQMLSVTIVNGVIRQKELLKDTSKKDSSRLDKTSYKLVQPGDIAYNKMRAWQGAIGASEYRGIISPAYVVQRPRNGNDSGYLHHLLRTPAFSKEAERWSYGITSDMWSLRPEHFKRIYTCVPPLTEQRAIVRFLDHADHRIRRYIRAKERLIELLVERRRKATRKVVQSPDVAHHRLETLVKVVQRPVNRTSEQTYIPIGLYNRGRGIFRKVPRRGDELGDSSFFWIAEGDLVISGQFAWEGAVALVGESESGCVASHRYPVLRGKPGVMETGFLLTYLQTGWGQVLLNHHSRGAAGRNRPLNLRTFLKEKMPMPALATQRQLAKELQRETILRKQVDDLKALLLEYRTRLVADVVTGKIDVREAAASLPQVDSPKFETGPAREKEEVVS